MNYEKGRCPFFKKKKKKRMSGYLLEKGGEEEKYIYKNMTFVVIRVR
jgi:hypothetical protein